jgi:uncharacterized membrane protein
VTALTLPARRRGSLDLVLRTAARGAVLIGLAVVIGIVLLQVVDKGGGSGGVAPPVTQGGDGSTTSTTSDDGRPAAEVRVLVLNGSGVDQAASTKANELRGLGYAIAGTGDAAAQTGTTVACVNDFDKEAAALSRSISGSTVTAYPTEPPPDSENADCIVTLGA